MSCRTISSLTGSSRRRKQFSCDDSSYEKLILLPAGNAEFLQASAPDSIQLLIISDLFGLTNQIFSTRTVHNHLRRSGLPASLRHRGFDQVSEQTTSSSQMNLVFTSIMHARKCVWRRGDACCAGVLVDLLQIIQGDTFQHDNVMSLCCVHFLEAENVCFFGH